MRRLFFASAAPDEGGTVAEAEDYIVVFNEPVEVTAPEGATIIDPFKGMMSGGNV